MTYNVFWTSGGEYLATGVDVWIPELCGRFILNSHSHVSLILNFAAGVIPSQPLIEASSTAIWNRDKIVTAIAASVWFTNVATSIHGKHCSLSLPTDHRE
jgi:hypothetical protein